MMTLRRPRVGLLVLLAAALSLHGATTPLNPLVTRTPQPTGPVPPECAEALAPAPMPRLDVAEIPLQPLPAPIERAAIPAPPPTGSLRDALEATQTALTRNDRPAFDASLASARELLRDYPSGAQRKSAEELVKIYETAARLSDAQYESPFLDEGSAEAAALRAYPGYENAVRRSTLTRDGRRWFPAGESRDFLGRIAAERLRGIGIQAPAPRLARNDRPGVPDTPRAMPAPRRSPSSTTTSRGTTSRPRRTPSTTTASRTTRPPRSSAPSRPRLTAPVETRTPAPATSTPSTPNPSAPPTAAAAPEPAAPATGTTSSAPATASPAAEAPAAVPEPVATETSETTATTTAPATPEPAPAAQPSRGRSVILPTILILIGLGVLILLFRASK